MAVALARLRIQRGEPIPKELRTFTVRVLSRDKRPAKRDKRSAKSGRPPENHVRDVVICALVERAREADPKLDYTSKCGRVCACSIVSEQLRKARIYLEYDTVVDTWKDMKRTQVVWRRLLG